jgi:hypothetical protein
MRMFPIFFAAVVFLAASGCARPPQNTIDGAERAVEAAKAAGAAFYAPESLAAAERAQAALEIELSAQEKRGKLARSYIQAESLALEALIAGERAAAEAEREKEQAKGDTLSIVARVTTALEEAEAMVAQAAEKVGNTKRAQPKDSELRGMLREARALLAQAQRDLEGGRYADSLMKARSAGEKVDAVKRDVRRAIARSSKSGRKR